VKLNNIDIKKSQKLYKEGAKRFNTKLVRNLTWMVQIQRVMRSLMIEHLNFLSTPVVSGIKITNDVITEYNANDRYDNGDFNGTKFSQF